MSAYDDVILADSGVLGYWKLQADANDSASGGTNGSAGTGVTFGSGAKLVNAQASSTFDGSGDAAIGLGNYAPLNNRTFPLTLSAWFKLANVTGNKLLVYKWGGDNNTNRVLIYAEGANVVAAVSSGGSFLIARASGALSAGVALNLVVTWSTATTFKVWVNAVAKTLTYDLQQSVTTLQSSSQPTYLHSSMAGSVGRTLLIAKEYTTAELLARYNKALESDAVMSAATIPSTGDTVTLTFSKAMSAASMAASKFMLSGALALNALPASGETPTTAWTYGLARTQTRNVLKKVRYTGSGVLDVDGFVFVMPSPVTATNNVPAYAVSSPLYLGPMPGLVPSSTQHDFAGQTAIGLSDTGRTFNGAANTYDDWCWGADPATQVTTDTVDLERLGNILEAYPPSWALHDWQEGVLTDAIIAQQALVAQATYRAGFPVGIYGFFVGGRAADMAAMMATNDRIDAVLGPHVSLLTFTRYFAETSPGTDPEEIDYWVTSLTEAKRLRRLWQRIVLYMCPQTNGGLPGVNDIPVAKTLAYYAIAKATLGYDPDVVLWSDHYPNPRLQETVDAINAVRAAAAGSVVVQYGNLRVRGRGSKQYGNLRVNGAPAVVHGNLRTQRRR